MSGIRVYVSVSMWLEVLEFSHFHMYYVSGLFLFIVYCVLLLPLLLFFVSSYVIIITAVCVWLKKKHIQQTSEPDSVDFAVVNSISGGISLNSKTPGLILCIIYSN